jgi:hypothetical protein
MSCRYCPAAAQGTVFGMAVVLSILFFMLCLFLGSLPSGRPRSVGPSRFRLRRLDESCSRGSVYPRSEKRVRVGARRWALARSPVGEAGRSRRRASFLFGQAFRSERRAALLVCSLGIWAGPGVARRSQRCLLGRAFAGEQVR